MILSGIDIGTNTLRLLVAETCLDSFHEVYADRRITRLGQDLDRMGRLSREAEERTLEALLDFAESIRRHAAVHTAAIGTSAFRNASNSPAFINEVKKRTGLDISVISGEQEARLTLRGVVRALKGLGTQNGNFLESALVIDIGGGSTELIMTSPEAEPAMASLPLGAVYLTDRFIKKDPPSKREIELLRHTIKKSLDRSCVMMRPGSGGAFVGTAGAITTLAAMDLGLAEYAPDKINGHTMTKATINGIIRKLEESSLEERRSLPGLEPGREDIILAGAVIAREIMERFGFMTIVVSDWGLREGIVLDLYEKIAAQGVSDECKKLVS